MVSASLWSGMAADIGDRFRVSSKMALASSLRSSSSKSLAKLTVTRCSRQSGPLLKGECTRIAKGFFSGLGVVAVG